MNEKLESQARLAADTLNEKLKELSNQMGGPLGAQRLTPQQELELYDHKLATYTPQQVMREAARRTISSKEGLLAYTKRMEALRAKLAEKDDGG